MVSRGERELRGERRGKGGRSLLATAAPFFFVYLCASPLQAQQIGIFARAGASGSTTLLTDEVAATTDPGVDEQVRLRVAAAPTLGAGIRASFWPRVGVTADVDYTMSELVAEDDDGERTIQDLALVEGKVGFLWAVGPRLEVGGGAGLLWYLTDETGIFAQGTDTSPLVEARVAWTPPLAGGRVALQGMVQTHRFGTAVIQAEGGQDGNVIRYGIVARVRLAEVGR